MTNVKFLIVYEYIFMILFIMSKVCEQVVFFLC